MPRMDLSSAAHLLNRLADSAEKAIMPNFRALTSVENKAGTGFDPVTKADRDAEIAMREVIAAEFPDHGIVGEEFGDLHPDAEWVWVLDPIDGTRAFISGLPTWGTLIGLTRNRRPVLGMMAQPFTGERFSGDRRHASYTEPGGPRDLRTRPCKRLEDAVLFTTTPAMFSSTEAPYYRHVESSVRLVRYGVDCYAYAMVA
ncbi:MAG: histidinol-phosphatase, partial [Hyphomicrobiaceae bacterium]|nr:histidinol-phosphatase [Hyphomicrobiaceae bacterium]